MKKIKLGTEEIFPVGLGTWHMGDDPRKEAAEIEALRSGIEAGANLIDTAEMYGEGNSERLVGKAIQPYQRESLYLVSKIYPWNASKANLMVHLDQSLSRLQTDYLDLYLLHWTGSIPLAETVAAMEKAKQSGKIRDWGVSNFDVSDMAELWACPGGQNCITNEVLYHLGSRGIEVELAPWMAQHNLPVIAYSPVAQGDTLGNRFKDTPRLLEIAEKHQVSLFQLLLAWVIRNGRTIAIPQSSNAAHVRDNVKAADLQLNETEWREVDLLFPAPATKPPLDIL